MCYYPWGVRGSPLDASPLLPQRTLFISTYSCVSLDIPHYLPYWPWPSTLKFLCSLCTFCFLTQEFSWSRSSLACSFLSLTNRGHFPTRSSLVPGVSSGTSSPSQSYQCALILHGFWGYINYFCWLLTSLSFVCYSQSFMKAEGLVKGSGWDLQCLAERLACSWGFTNIHWINNWVKNEWDSMYMES
jgi:hypothetical protein